MKHTITWFFAISYQTASLLLHRRERDPRILSCSSREVSVGSFRLVVIYPTPRAQTNHDILRVLVLPTNPGVSHHGPSAPWLTTISRLTEAWEDQDGEFLAISRNFWNIHWDLGKFASKLLERFDRSCSIAHWYQSYETRAEYLHNLHLPREHFDVYTRRNKWEFIGSSIRVTREV